jgi:hypothetical protein
MIYKTILTLGLMAGSLFASKDYTYYTKYCSTTPVETLIGVKKGSWGGRIAKIGQATYQVCSKEASSYKKSIVFVEGFDLENTRGLPEIFSQINKGGTISNLIESGWSIVLVDLPNSEKYEIMGNSYVLSLAMDKYWAETAKSEPLKFVGISMGGIYSVLANHANEFEEYEFEHIYYSRNDKHLAIKRPGDLSRDRQIITVPIQKGTNFKTDLITTLDSPHNGAYIPKSIQDFVYMAHEDKQVVEKTQALRNGVNDFYKTLNGRLAKQILTVNIFDPTQKMHLDFMDEYIAKRNELKNSFIRLVGLVSGSWNGKPQEVGYGKTIIDYEYFEKKKAKIDNKFWGWVGRVTKASTFYAGPQTKLMSQSYDPKGSNAIRAKLRIASCKAKSDCDDKSWIKFNNKKECEGPESVPMSDCQNYENRSGGTMDYYELILDNLNSWKVDADSRVANSNHSFVPTSSAAGILWDDEMLAPSMAITVFETNGREAENFSFFDKIYHQNQNLPHAEIKTRFQLKSLLAEIEKSTQINIVPTIITPLLLN